MSVVCVCHGDSRCPLCVFVMGNQGVRCVCLCPLCVFAMGTQGVRCVCLSWGLKVSVVMGTQGFGSSNVQAQLSPVWAAYLKAHTSPH